VSCELRSFVFSRTREDDISSVVRLRAEASAEDVRDVFHPIRCLINLDVSDAWHVQILRLSGQFVAEVELGYFARSVVRVHRVSKDKIALEVISAWARRSLVFDRIHRLRVVKLRLRDMRLSNAVIIFIKPFKCTSSCAGTEMCMLFP